MTGSMERAIRETDRRRTRQEAYNAEHGITPATIKRNISDVLADVSMRDGLIVETGDAETPNLVGHNLKAYISELEEQMKRAAADLEFETAAAIRDQIRRLEMDELGVPAGQQVAPTPPVRGRSMGGAPGTRTTRFEKMKKKGFGGKRQGSR
jgi:excinuclease ABC subunit B